MSKRTLKILEMAKKNAKNADSLSQNYTKTSESEPKCIKPMCLQDASVSSSSEKRRSSSYNLRDCCVRRRLASPTENVNDSIFHTNPVSFDSISETDPFSTSSDISYNPDSTDRSSNSSRENETIDNQYYLPQENNETSQKIKFHLDNGITNYEGTNSIHTNRYESPDDNIDASDSAHVSLNANRKVEQSSYHEKPKLTLSVARKDASGKRIRDKRHCCYICNKILTNNMARHFESVHSNETEVAKIISHPKRSKKRRQLLENLIRVGDFYHNCNVLALKEGELILVRCTTETCSPSYTDFGPCPYCLGFLNRKYMWHHVKFCRKTKSKSENQKGALNESSAILFEILGKKVDESFRHDIVNSLRYDDTSNIIKEDTLILKLGTFMYEKYGAVQREMIRQAMRQVARLKCKLQETHNIHQPLSKWLTPRNFDSIITATKALCSKYSENAGEHNFQIPSLALKLGHILRKCIAIEKGTALRQGLLDRHAELKSFLELMDLEWSARISSRALSTLHRRKMNTTQLLPLTSDLMKLNTYLSEEMRVTRNLVISKCTPYLWNKLASVTLSRVILFNKRRSGEAAKMYLHDYQNRPSWSEQGTEEFKNSLTPLEIDLAKKLGVVEIIGKRGRKVHVILTDEVKQSIDLLIATRDLGDISPQNKYVFARSRKSHLNSHMRGHDCLRKACAEANLVNADNITSTKLRKYIATVSQIFNLKDHECDWLARHLGHDIRVHRDFYRIHESAVEMTKISRLLIAVDKGEARKYAGKSLEEINIEELPQLAESDEELDENQVVENEIMSLETDNKDDFRSKIVNRSQKNASETSSDKKATRKPWTVEAVKIMLSEFRREIKNKQLPGKTDCMKIIEKYPHQLQGRKWTDLKFYVKNHLAKIDKCQK